MSNPILDSYFDELPDEQDLDTSGADQIEQLQADNPSSSITVEETEANNQTTDPTLPEEEGQQDAEQQSDDTRVAGQGGSEFAPLENIGEMLGGIDVGETLKDTVGTLLPSLGIAEQATDLINPLIENILPGDPEEGQTPMQMDSPLDLVTGASLGVAESVGETAEVIGDTTKTLLGIAEVGDNISDMKTYDWAKWNLGADELGAQTGPGKIAQGFLEFGLLFAGTGGFGGTAKALTATSKIGRLGQAAKGAVPGVMRGIAADMISAMGGEGNMSNMIKDNAPEWYPTWMMALAVDEDDNPWEAALKTAFEGGLLGGTADTLSAFLSGSRAARRVRDAGGDVAAQEKAALEAAEGKLYHGTNKADAIKETGFRPSAGETDTLGRGVYMTRDPQLARSYGDEVVEGVDDGLNIREMSYEEAQEVFNKYGGMNEYGGPVDVDALSKEFGGQFDGVSVKGLYDSDSAIDEVLLFNPAKADSAIAPRSYLKEASDSIDEAGNAVPARDLTEQEITVAQRTLERTSPIAAQAGPSPALEEAVNNALRNNNIDRFSKLSALMDRKAAGIPYYWDDVAGSFSEYFTAGSRDLSQGMSPESTNSLKAWVV